ncbi:Cfd1p [Lipomyces oligophaga]|uniref:Cfd1p n=1 Tax=Lipomyces oligophaga TaxID=45792 RepID=UPI0034CDF166
MNEQNSLDTVKNVILILSGKGGVGKSSVTTQIALSLVRSGYSVGVLDIDLTGPSAPRMFGLEGSKIHQSSAGWVPVYTDSTKKLSVLSIGFLLRDRGDSVVWRGPKKTAMIRQFVRDVVWGDLDFLLIDTPPGTSDEHIAIAESLRDLSLASGRQHPLGSVLVTTPQAVATADVRKELNFCTKVNFPVLGVIENMSGFVCPHCAECSNIFSSGGGEKLAQQFNIPFFGAVPIDPEFVLMIEKNNNKSMDNQNDLSLVEKYATSNLYSIFKHITDKLIAQADLPR